MFITSDMNEKRAKKIGKMAAKKLKGVSQSAVQKYCTHQAYKNMLEHPQTPMIVDFRKIVIKDDVSMTTSYFSKASLSCFDSKRFLLDSYKSRPFGHYLNEY